MTTIDNIIEMKEQPGVVVVGKRNIDTEKVFDELNGFLSEFYFDQELVFVSEIFDKGQTKYFCPVYVAEPEKGKKAKKYATIKIERFSPKKMKEFVAEWDFPHAPFEYTQQVFGVYFNLVNQDKVFTEREAFLNYVKPTLN